MTPDQQAAFDSATGAAHRFFRALADGDDATVAQMLRPGLPATTADWVARQVLFLEPRDCAVVADEFEQRVTRARFPESSLDQCTIWVYAPDGRRVHLSMFRLGDWRVFPGLPAVFLDEDS